VKLQQAEGPKKAVDFKNPMTAMKRTAPDSFAERAGRTRSRVLLPTWFSGSL
jgi:hypothetical protein